MVILKSICARVCVCDMGNKGKGLRKQSWDAPVTFPFCFFSLPLFELEVKDTTDTFNLKGGGGGWGGGMDFCNNKKFDAEFWEKHTLAGMDTEKNNLRQYFHNIK